MSSCARHGAHCKWLVLLTLMIGTSRLPADSSLIGEAKPLDWQDLLRVGTGMAALLNELVHLHDDLLPAVALLALALACVACHLRAAHGLMSIALFRCRHFAMGGTCDRLSGASGLAMHRPRPHSWRLQQCG